MEDISRKIKLKEFLGKKLEHAQSGSTWFWLHGIYKVEQYIGDDETLDEITMQGEFNEEIDIIKEWINEWKEMNNGGH
tara:strand:- start:122 stop:355 length:234 start_codon:yes stop_codon:yes gene_type:complete